MKIIAAAVVGSIIASGYNFTSWKPPRQSGRAFYEHLPKRRGKKKRGR